MPTRIAQQIFYDTKAFGPPQTPWFLRAPLRARFLRGVGLLLLCLVHFSIVAPQASAAEDAAPRARLKSTAYALRPWPDGSVMRNPNTAVASYIQIYPNTAVSGDAVLNLWYSYSPIVIPDISTMTVSVNGTPVDSRILHVEESARANWRLRLPSSHFRTGMNDVEVSVVHRTIDGLCRDIDNDANWFILRPETSLNLVLARSADRLSDFPRPFVDPYTPDEMNTVVVLPDDFGEATIAELLNVGTTLGRGSLGGIPPRRLWAKVGETGSYRANEIALVRAASWLPAGARLADDEAQISLDTTGDGYARLAVVANDDRGLAKGVSALARPRLVQTFPDDEVRLSSPLPALEAQFGMFGAGKNRFTLPDFGFEDDLRVSGAFHQEANLFLYRPANYMAAEGSYVELHFRHSPILDPKKSAVTIYINDIPIRAVALIKENANGGVLRAPIPASELARTFWNIRFGFYHDLGIVDCSKRYDDVAWSVVEKDTNVYLKKSGLEYVPALEKFPTDFVAKSNGQIDLTLLMMDAPTDTYLTAALRVAYYVGLVNRGNVVWHVRDGRDAKNFNASDAPGTVIALGKNEAGAWNILSEYLHANPDAPRYGLAEWVDAAPEVLPRFDIYQAGKLADDKLFYAFMYHGSPGRITDMIDFSNRAGSPLAGQMSLVDERGDATAYRTQPRPEATRLPWLDFIAAKIGNTAAIYGAVLLAVVLVTLFLTLAFGRRERKKGPRH